MSEDISRFLCGNVEATGTAGRLVIRRVWRSDEGHLTPGEPADRSPPFANLTARSPSPPPPLIRPKLRVLSGRYASTLTRLLRFIKAVARNSLAVDVRDVGIVFMLLF